MNSKHTALLAMASMLSTCSAVGLADTASSTAGQAGPAPVTVSTASVPIGITPSTHPIRAIHVTSWQAGSGKYRHYLDTMFKTTIVNAVTIDIKEYQGEVYIPGVPVTQEVHSYVSAMPDLEKWLAELKKQGIYTIARQVVFKDNIMPRKLHNAGVHTQQGELWFDRHHVSWADPYNKEARRYNLLIALQAAKLGFDEVQFDYIRFPTDGNLKMIHYDKPHDPKSACGALVEFLNEAAQLLHPMGTKISIDVFGLTTSDTGGMGIGQMIVPMTQKADYVCPMVYPSHYAKGEYGIPVPNSEPYKTVRHGLRDAIKVLGPEEARKLRPYLQDFSLGVHYGKKEVLAQIQAAAELGILDWSLWNPRCVYTLSALTPDVQPALPAASPAPKTYQVNDSTR
jgi:hypothetical protein